MFEKLFLQSVSSALEGKVAFGVLRGQEEAGMHKVLKMI